MSLKISQYTTSVSALASGDLMDVSKLISTSPDVYSSDKLNYSVLLTEIIADGSILTGSGTTNYISKFSSSGTLANSSLRDDGNNVSINNAVNASYKLYINSDKLVGLGVFNNAVSGSNNYGISGSATNANTSSNVGVFGNALLSSGGTNLGVRGQSASQTVTSSDIITANGTNIGGFFQGNASSGIAYGLVATADATTNQASATFTGAYIRADNAGTKYSLRLVDGSEGTGKFLKSVTSIGQANWAALAITDITASLGTSLQVVRMNAGATALEYATLSVASTNLGNANLTADAAERIYTLFGNAATEKLIFQNLAGNDILTLYGNKNVEIGTQSGLVTEALINLSGTNGTFRMTSGSNLYSFYYDAPAFNLSIRSSSSYKVDIFGGTGSIVTTGDTSSGYYLNKLSGTATAALYNYNGSNFYMANSSGTRLINIESANGFGHVVGGWAVGLSYSIPPTARLHVTGSGSTSATTTALYENSSSVAALKVKDDGYCILKANNAAIASGDLANNEMSFYIDESTNHCVVKVKYSSGTVKTGTFNLT